MLEAFLENASSAKAAKKLLRKLLGSYGKLAASPSGCFLVEKCFSCAVRNCSYTCQGQDEMVCMLLSMSGSCWLCVCMSVRACAHVPLHDQWTRMC